MTTIVTRAGKGSPLTNTEVDNNFSNLNTAKLELGQAQSSGTANSLLFLNGTKLVSSGTALTFDGAKLNNSSGSAAGIIQSTDTSGVGNFVRILADATFGSLINFSTGSSLRFATSTDAFGSFSEQMRLTSTGLGIGTSSPATKLHVAGPAGSPGKLTLSEGGAQSVIYATRNSDTNGDLRFQTEIGGTIADRMVIDYSGNLGIGTSSPSAKLHVVGNGFFSTGLTVGDTSAVSWGAWTSIQENGFFDAGGNFLHNAVKTSGANDTWNYRNNGPATRYKQLNSVHSWYTAPSGTAGTAISFTQAMTLDASQRLMLGTTTTYGGNLTLIPTNGNPTTASSTLNQIAIGEASVNSAYKLFVGYLNIGGGYAGSLQSIAGGAGTNLLLNADGGNVGIGTTLPGDKLEVAGNARVRDTLVMQRSTSSAYLSVLNYGNTLGGTKTDNLSFGLVGGGDLLIWTNGAERLRVTESGNVGIGTSSPLSALGFGEAASAAGITFQSTNTTFNSGKVAVVRASIAGSGNGALLFETYQGGSGGGERARITSSGGFSLGTTNDPGAGNINLADSKFIGWGNLDTLILGNSASNFIYFRTGGAEKIRIDSAGNLLVGGTNSYGKLAVYGTAPATGYATYFSNQTAYQDLAGYANASLGNGAWIWEPGTVPGSGVANFYTRFKSRASGGTTNHNVVIDGDLLVGTTNSSFGAGVGHKFSAGGTSGQVINFVNGNTYHLYNENATNNGYRFYVNSNGGISNYSANNSNLSDERVKKDITLAGDYLAKVCAIPVRLYRYKDQSDDAFNLGVIAQEVEAAAPELVCNDGFGDTPADGVPLKTVYQTDLQYALMKAIQELKAIVDAQAAQIAALQAA